MYVSIYIIFLIQYDLILKTFNAVKAAPQKDVDIVYDIVQSRR